MKRYQNRNEGREVEKYGCAVMSAIELASRRTGKNDVVIVSLKALGKDLFVTSWDALFAELGAPAKCRYEKPGYVPREGEDVILKHKRLAYEHFSLIDYDPWYPKSKAATQGELVAVLVVKWLVAMEEKPRAAPSRQRHDEEEKK